MLDADEAKRAREAIDRVESMGPVEMVHAFGYEGRITPCMDSLLTDIVQCTGVRISTFQIEVDCLHIGQNPEPLTVSTCISEEDGWARGGMSLSVGIKRMWLVLREMGEV